MSALSRVERFKALQDVLGPVPLAGDRKELPESLFAGLSILLPDAVVQQATHIADVGGICCVQSNLGREFFKVQGKKQSYIVLLHGVYCSCQYYWRRVLETGELCCKHWLAVQIARRSQSVITTVQNLDENEFVLWAQEGLVSCG